MSNGVRFLFTDYFTHELLNSDIHNLQTETLHQQYELVRFCC